jgi:hypothetical protein
MEKHPYRHNDDGWDLAQHVDKPPIYGWAPNPDDSNPPLDM